MTASINLSLYTITNIAVLPPVGAKAARVNTNIYLQIAQQALSFPKISVACSATMPASTKSDHSH